jgi:hypothetical protein
LAIDINLFPFKIRSRLHIAALNPLMKGGITVATKKKAPAKKVVKKAVKKKK